MISRTTMTSVPPSTEIRHDGMQCAIDQLGAIVDDFDLYARRQGFLDFGQALFSVSDDDPGILSD